MSLFENKGSMASTIVVSLAPDRSGNYVCDVAIEAHAVTIQRAITRAGVFNGNVYFKEGTYTEAAEAIITLPSNIVIEGSSDKTVTFDNIMFRLSLNGVDGGDLVFRNFRVIGDDIEAAIRIICQDCTISNLLYENIDTSITDTVDSAGAFQLFVDNTGTIDNVRFIDCKAIDSTQPGWYFDDGGGTGNNLINNVWFDRCEAINCGRVARSSDFVTGFNLCEGDASMTIENIFLDQCKAIRSWESGFHFEGAPVKVNVKFTDCTSNLNGTDKPAPLGGSGFLLSDAVSVKGCTANDNAIHGIRVAGGYDCTITSNVCDGNGENGIDLNSFDGSTVTGNTCSDNGEMGILIESSDDNTFTGNHCNGNTERGILLTGSVDNALTGNNCNGNTLDGIALIGSSDGNTLTGNQCGGNDDRGIYLVNVDNNTLTGNTCNGNTEEGIQLSGSVNNTVTGNTCNGNTQSGILVSTSTDNTLTGNTCSLNVRHGINVSSSSNNTVEGNTCNGNDSGDAGLYSGIYLIDDSDDNIIMGSTCNDNDTYGIKIHNDTCDRNWVKNNQLRGNTLRPFNDSGTDTRLASKPFQFIKELNGNYLTTSPTGIEIDIDTEGAILQGHIPIDAQQVVRIRVFAVALDGPIDVGGQMHLVLTFNSGAPNAVYNTGATSWTLANHDSEEADYVANDVVTWVVEDGDVGNELRALAAGNWFDLIVTHEDGDDPDGATDAVFGSMALEYV